VLRRKAAVQKEEKNLQHWLGFTSLDFIIKMPVEFRRSRVRSAYCTFVNPS